MYWIIIVTLIFYLTTAKARARWSSAPEPWRVRRVRRCRSRPPGRMTSTTIISSSISSIIVIIINIIIIIIISGSSSSSSSSSIS